MRDQVGTVYRVYDHRNHQIADARVYDSFDNLVSQSGTTKTPLGFQGKYFDQESGLNYFYHRYYNLKIGRFISEDPVGLDGGLNLFSFVGNNPVKFTDKFGLERDWRDQMPNGGGWKNVSKKDWIYGWQAALESSSFLSKIEDAWQSSVGYNWCCFANCIGKNKELLNIFTQQIIYNIMISATFKENPGIYFVLINKPIWEWTGLIFNLSSLYGVIDEVGNCFKACLNH